MSDYKPMVTISLNTAWNVADVLAWMCTNPMMDRTRRAPMVAMSDEIMKSVQELYQEREETSLYFKAIVDDMPDDIVAMMEHEYGVKDLLELNEKQLGEAFWYAVQSGLLREQEADKLVCLEKRPGQAPRVRILSDVWDVIRSYDGFKKAEYLSMEFLKDVFIFWAKENEDDNLEMAVGLRDGKYVSLTEQQVQELMKEWSNQQ